MTYQIVVDIYNRKLSIQTHVLLFIKFYCEIDDSQFVFIEKSSISQPFIPIEYFQHINKAIVDEFKYNTCELPIFLDDTGIIHSGLCNVVRKIISKCPNYIKLLGPTGSCLKACAEVSSWTKLIEVEFPNSIIKIKDFIKSDENSAYNMFKTFENNLSSEPVITNISKLQHMNKRLKHGEFDSNIFSTRYAEGLQFLLTDLLLFCYISICLTLDSNAYKFIHDNFPKICQWYCVVLENNISLKSAALNCGYKIMDLNSINLSTLTTNRMESLSRRKSSKIQSPINRNNKTIFPLINEINFNNNLFQYFETFYHEISPSLFIEDNFPVKRRQKKLQQLQNMIVSILCLEPRDGQTIVDFCSGSGHLGILLANILPKCKIICIENKEESLDRAYMQAEKLNLKNVIFIRSNIGHFKAPFDIGTCLHGCGFVTDLVLNKCYAAKANYVVAPCCYGAAKNSSDISYPRSHHYSSSPGAEKCFHCIMDAADAPISQIHKLNKNITRSRQIDFFPNYLVEEIKSTLTNEKKKSDNAYIEDPNFSEQINCVSSDLVLNFSSISNLDDNLKNSTESLSSINEIREEDSLSKRCMLIIDNDRQMYAQELGYQVNIRTMIPSDCTPKNNILIGRYINCNTNVIDLY